MPIVVTGSIATDHLMHFPGKFTDSLLPDQLHRVSLSFLVDDLVVRRGGVAANICFGMGLLGVNPILLDAVGADFDDYSSWLQRHGVDCSHVHIFEDVQTARFVCTTDDDMNQIGSFYAGAMARSREIEIGPVANVVSSIDLVMISAGDPAAMVRHAEECRQRGFTFAADPSQQLARMEGVDAAKLVDGAAFWFSNDYELGLLLSKTGWTESQLLERVGHRVTTLGSKGVEIVAADGSHLHIPVVPELAKIDPTGVGDAFRSGFVAGQYRGLDFERSAQLGSLMATLVLETIGTQEYTFDPITAMARLAACYGDPAAQEISNAMGFVTV
ncbi:adenosine kinase [Nakamurella sp. UYEF19]